MESEQPTFVIVSPQQAEQKPYPYVFVEDDGSVRELGVDEKSFLETPFLPMDGGRPAIKESYLSQNGWGSVRGFCRRSLIPEDISIQPAEPSPPDDGDEDAASRG